MANIQSGKELCDQFFEGLMNRSDIDEKTVALLKNLYSEDKLTADNILKGLLALRVGQNDGAENQD